MLFSSLDKSNLTNLQVLQDAIVPRTKSGPKRGRMLLIGGLLAKALSAVFESEKLSGLRTLSVTGGIEELFDEDVEVFATSQLTLERLFLTGYLRLESGIEPLLEGAEWLRSLKWLALNRCELSDEDVKQIAKSEVLQGLERLELAHNELTPAGVLVFRSPEVMPRLKHLDLSEIWWETRKLDPLRSRFRTGLKL
jgi:hypothetical protein